MPRSAAIPGIGPQASPGVSHAQARIVTAATGPGPSEMPLFRRFSSTTAGFLQLPAAHPTMAVPILAAPAWPATGGDITAAHTVRRKHWWEL